MVSLGMLPLAVSGKALNERTSAPSRIHLASTLWPGAPELGEVKVISIVPSGAPSTAAIISLGEARSGVLLRKIDPALTVRTLSTTPSGSGEEKLLMLMLAPDSWIWPSKPRWRASPGVPS